MKINLSPSRRDDQLSVSVAGEILTINDLAVDLSFVTEGIEVMAEEIGCDWLAGAVSRSDGNLELTLILPHGPNAPHETLFPEPIVVLSDGPVDLPQY